MAESGNMFFDQYNKVFPEMQEKVVPLALQKMKMDMEAEKFNQALQKAKTDETNDKLFREELAKIPSNATVDDVLGVQLKFGKPNDVVNTRINRYKTDEGNETRLKVLEETNKNRQELADAKNDLARQLAQDKIDNAVKLMEMRLAGQTELAKLRDSLKDNGVGATKDKTAELQAYIDKNYTPEIKRLEDMGANITPEQQAKLKLLYTSRQQTIDTLNTVRNNPNTKIRWGAGLPTSNGVPTQPANDKRSQAIKVLNDNKQPVTEANIKYVMGQI